MNCPKCGAPLIENARFCTSCGGNIDADTPQAPPPQQEPQAAPGDAVPPEIQGFNIAAFLMNWVWCLGNRLWVWGIVVLIVAFIPIVQIANLGIAIYLGIKGNELSWKTGRFTNVQQFKDTQRVWAIVSIVLLCLGVLLLILGLALGIATPNFLSAKKRAGNTACLQALSSVKTGLEMKMADNGSCNISGLDELASEMLPGCESADGSDCKGKVQARLDEACRANSVNVEVAPDGMSYRIKGMSRDGCAICVTPEASFPADSKECLTDFKCE